MPGCEGMIGNFLSKVFLGTQWSSLGTVLPKTETEPLASFSRMDNVGKLFLTRGLSAKKRGAAGISTLRTPREEDLTVEDPLVMVQHMSP